MLPPILELNSLNTQNNQKTGIDTSVGINPPIPADFGPTVSGFSALGSVIAILIAIASYRRAGKLEKAAWFEQNFGEALRLAYRELDRKSDTLNAFIYPMGTSLATQKDEFSGQIAVIEESLVKIRVLMKELDTSSKVEGDGWTKLFDRHNTDIIKLLNGALDQHTPQLFNRVVMKAKDEIDRLLNDFRKLIGQLF